MKKLIILLFATTVFTACKNDAKTEPKTDVLNSENSDKTIKQSDGLTLLRGEFIYYDDAAVLQVGSSVFGVVVDDKMHELNNMGKPYRTEATDGIIVEVRGKLIPKPEGNEGWPFNVEIKEILNVKKTDPKQNEVVKIGK